MKNSEFDNKITEAFNRHAQIIDNDELWDNIEPHLKERKKSRFIIWFFLVFLAMASLGIYNNYFVQKPNLEAELKQDEVIENTIEKQSSKSEKVVLENKVKKQLLIESKNLNSQNEVKTSDSKGETSSIKKLEEKAEVQEDVHIKKAISQRISYSNPSSKSKNTNPLNKKVLENALDDKNYFKGLVNEPVVTQNKIAQTNDNSRSSSPTIFKDNKNYKINTNATNNSK